MNTGSISFIPYIQGIIARSVPTLLNQQTNKSEQFYPEIQQMYRPSIVD